MNNIYDDFQKENNEILRYMLEDRFFSKLEEDDFGYQKEKGINIELYITSVCNQKCEYCYLARYGNKLYPKEIRNVETILKNAKILLKYFIKRNFSIYELDLFSGEIWGMEFGNQILDEILDAVKNGLKIDTIMIPSNCSFVLNEKVVEVIQAYINEFKKCGTLLKFSASVEGKYLEEKTRPYFDESTTKRKSTDEFYNSLFRFCAKNSFGFHPMVSASGIEDWIKNFDWWVERLEAYHFRLYDATMFLEVRNDDWTSEKIDEYLKFLNHILNYLYNDYYKKDIDFMTRDMLLKCTKAPQNYNIAQLSVTPKSPSCTISRALTVRLGDLAIVPCHRLSYDKFLYGKFKVKDDKIIGVEAQNIQLANKIYFTSVKHSHKCDVCEYNTFCMRGCLGSQFEVTKDPLLPCDTVCDLFQAKIHFLIFKYKEFGIKDALFKIKDEKTSDADFAMFLYRAMDKIEKGDKYLEWIKKNSTKS